MLLFFSHSLPQQKKRLEPNPGWANPRDNLADREKGANSEGSEKSRRIILHNNVTWNSEKFKATFARFSSPNFLAAMHRLSTTSSRSLRKAVPSLARGAHKEIKFSNEGRASILKGVDVLANAVSVTLGPKGLHNASSPT